MELEHSNKNTNNVLNSAVLIIKKVINKTLLFLRDDENNFNSFNKFKLSALLFTIMSLMIIFAPYQGDSTLTLSGPILRMFFKFSIYAMLFANSVIVFQPLIKKGVIEKRSLIAIIPLVIYLILTVFYTYGKVINLSGILMILLCIQFVMASSEIKTITFKYFKKAWVIISIVGIIAFFSYVFKSYIPYIKKDYYSSLDYLGVHLNYIDYLFVYLYEDASFVRLCGICNEPGYFGTLCAFILCISNLKLKECDNLIIFIAGACTLSAAFFIILIIYYMLKMMKNKKVFITMLVIIVSLLIILPNVKTDNAAINFLIRKVSINENGFGRRNNAIFEELFDKLLPEKPLFGYGGGYQASLKIDRVSSYKIYLIDYGIIGCILMWGSLLFSVLYDSNRNKRIIFYIIVFFASIYQRPNVFTFPYIVILYGGIAYLHSVSHILDEKKQRTKIKVIELIHGLNTGGAETLVKEYALRLDKNKFDVMVLCFDNYKNSPYEKVMEDNNINVVYIEDQYLFKNKHNAFVNKLKVIQGFILARNFIKKENPDVIHMHLPICKYVAFANLPKSTKLVYTMHGDPYRYKKYDALDYYSIKWLVKKYDMKIICLHNEMKEQVKNMFKTNNVIVLNNGIDFNLFDNSKSRGTIRKELGIANNKFVIGHVGRFNKVKNHHFIIDIFSKIHETNKNAFLLLVGDGDEKNNIINLLEQYNLHNDYLILSNRNDVPDILNAMDCFVFPSLSEGLGISLIEAQKAKLPCIVSENIPKHAIISNLVKVIPLNKKKMWISYLKKIKKPSKVKLNDEDWDMQKIIKKLERIYKSKDNRDDKKSNIYTKIQNVWFQKKSRDPKKKGC